MTAGPTYTPIATTTLGSAAVITFSSIPQTYTDLIIIATVTPAAAGTSNFFIQTNGDTSGTNYSMTKMYGNGTSASSSRNSNYGLCMLGDLNTNLQIQINLQNYSNTTTYKTFLSRYGYANFDTGTAVGLWRSTAAITSVVMYQDAPPYYLGAGSTATLYGIASA